MNKEELDIYSTAAHMATMRHFQRFTSYRFYMSEFCDAVSELLPQNDNRYFRPSWYKSEECYKFLNNLPFLNQIRSNLWQLK